MSLNRSLLLARRADAAPRAVCEHQAYARLDRANDTNAAAAPMAKIASTMAATIRSEIMPRPCACGAGAGCTKIGLALPGMVKLTWQPGQMHARPALAGSVSMRV